MNEFVIYVLELLVTCIVFYVGYLLIKDHTTPTFRRFYLLAWLIFSVLFPIVSVDSVVSPPVSVQDYVEATDLFIPENTFDQENSQVVEFKEPESIQTESVEIKADWGLILSVIYVCITSFLLVRIGFGLIQIWRLKASSVETRLGGRRIYEVSDNSFKGASFFNTVFMGSDLGDERDSIMQHEVLHSKLGHSFDILLSHIYCAVFWVNPLAWVMKKSISINNELEVDFLLKNEIGTKEYAHLLLNISTYSRAPSIVNQFSARHLKTRIVALKFSPIHKKWVSILSIVLLMIAFGLVSCKLDNDQVLSAEQMIDVKTITTRFSSHQTDTQQKTGKIVAIANFLPDGTLDEFVEQTTYPYDHEFDKKKVFWVEPQKAMLPYIMDGLSLKAAEKSFLYGNDWPVAYAQFLKQRSMKEESDFPLKEVIEIDDESLPREIKKIQDRESDKFISLFPDVIEYFEYDGRKVTNVYLEKIYPSGVEGVGIISFVGKDAEEIKKMKEELHSSSGGKKLSGSYIYNGDLLTGIEIGEYQYKFYYEDNTLSKSEYYKEGTLLNTRFHYYKNGLKDRTEIFNRYNEAEYTISYEYEFWD